MAKHSSSWMKTCNLPDSGEAAPVVGFALRVTVALFFAALVAGFGQFGAVSSLNDVAQHFGHHGSGTSLKSVVGLSGSVLGLGLAILRLASLASLPLSSLADRRGRTRVLQSLLLLGLVATSAASLSFSYWFFVISFAFARPLLSAASTIVQVITVELSSMQQRMHRLVVMAAGAGIGAGLSAVLHGVIRGPNSFRWLFAVAVIPALVIVPIVRTIPEPRYHNADVPFAHLGAVPRGVRGRLMIVSTAAFAIGMITGPANGFAFVYGEGVLKISPPRREG